MEGIWKRAFGKGLLEEGKFLEGNWHAPQLAHRDKSLKDVQVRFNRFCKKDQKAESSNEALLRFKGTFSIIILLLPNSKWRRKSFLVDDLN